MHVALADEEGGARQNTAEPIPFCFHFHICIRFMIVCPTPNDWCAELWRLTAYIKSSVLAHTVRYQTNNSLYDYSSLKSVCSSPSHIPEWHICPWPRCSLVYCISSRTKPVFSQTILTAWPHSPTSLNAKTAAASSKPLSSIVPHFGGKKELA